MNTSAVIGFFIGLAFGTVFGIIIGSIFGANIDDHTSAEEDEAQLEWLRQYNEKKKAKRKK